MCRRRGFGSFHRRETRCSVLGHSFERRTEIPGHTYLWKKRGDGGCVRVGVGTWFTPPRKKDGLEPPPFGVAEKRGDLEESVAETVC
jgi:ribosomal protein L37E